MKVKISLKCEKNGGMKMKFEKEVTLFLDFNEYDKVKEILIDKTVIGEEWNEEGVSVYMLGDEIDLEFIFELEDVLDERITLSYRYLGSATCIKSNGLD